jgi:hypothetical protein
MTTYPDKIVVYIGRDYVGRNISIRRNLSLDFMFACFDVCLLDGGRSDSEQGRENIAQHDRGSRALYTVDGLVWC